MRLEDYVGALEDLNKANVLKLNHVHILTRQGVAKLMLKDYHKALKDLDTANVIKPLNEACILQV
jgi:tetratricopeptide (TPR) repeat protein